MAEYLTILDVTEAEYREKGSKFLAYAYPVSDEEGIQAILDELWKTHPKARHVCYAYRLGKKAEKVRIDDNGEPSNTAGAPIMNHLAGKGLTFVLVAVVRYFGGTKLGKGGLIQAYGKVAKEALEKAEFIKKVSTVPLTVNIPYAAVNELMQLVKQNNLEIGEQEWGNHCQFTVYLPEDETEEWRERLYDINGLKVIA